MAKELLAPTIEKRMGELARVWCGKLLPIEILESQRGFYIGTADPESGPCSRESDEYFRSKKKAQDALKNGTWTQKQTP